MRPGNIPQHLPDGFVELFPLTGRTDGAELPLRRAQAAAFRTGMPVLLATQLLHLQVFPIQGTDFFAQFLIFHLRADSRCLLHFLISQADLAALTPQIFFFGLMGQPDLIDSFRVRLLPTPAEHNTCDHLLSGIVVDLLDNLRHHHLQLIAQGGIIAVEIQDILPDPLWLRMPGDELTNDVAPMPKHPVHIVFLLRNLAQRMDRFANDAFRWFKTG